MSAELERREQAIREAKRPPCHNCGQPGQHFAPPSMGEPGFFTCVKPEHRTSAQDPRPGLAEKVVAARAAYDALSPVDKALADSDQKRSFVRGQCGRDPGEDVLAAEVRRLRHETIVAAAHLFNLATSHDPRRTPVIVSAPPPARHHNLFPFLLYPDESGFLTSTGRFVGREEALKIARSSGQPMIDHPSRHEHLLFSEDLW